MKKVKIAFWIVVFGFIGLIFYQNWEFFKTESHLLINLGFFKYETPFLANAVFFVAFFMIGVLITYFFSLFKHFKDAKTIKVLKSKETNLVSAVSSLEKELSNFKAGPESVPVLPAADGSINVSAEAK
jgi:predicted membrane protein